jgi:hypothetical protein
LSGAVASHFPRSASATRVTLAVKEAKRTVSVPDAVRQIGHPPLHTLSRGLRLHAQNDPLA